MKSAKEIIEKVLKRDKLLIIEAVVALILAIIYLIGAYIFFIIGILLAIVLSNALKICALDVPVLCIILWSVIFYFFRNRIEDEFIYRLYRFLSRAR